MIIRTKEVIKNLSRFEKLSAKVAVESVSKTLAEAEATAKRNAPWTDRTGNARNSITGTKGEVDGNTVKGHLFIGVEYGKYLELCWGGKYRIVWPTIEDAAARRFPTWFLDSYVKNIRSFV